MNLVRIMTTIAALLMIFVASVIAGQAQTRRKIDWESTRERRDAGKCSLLYDFIVLLWHQVYPDCIENLKACKKVPFESMSGNEKR